jgi:myo-inositol-1(or 4)-monophosphatase
VTHLEEPARPARPGRPAYPDCDPDLDLDLLLAVACEAAEAAGRVALRWQARLGELDVEEKSGPGDLVSAADRDAERAVREVLTRRRPDDPVLGEEGGAATGSGGVRWVVDPVDGTTNFLYGRDDWTVSVAAVDAADGRVLAGVVAEPVAGRVTSARAGGGTSCDGRRVHVLQPGDLAHAMVELGLGRGADRARAGRLLDALVPRCRDVRRVGSAARALAQVATGRVDASWGPDLQPWDCAAGVLLVTEAGGVVGDLDGPVTAGIPRSGSVLAAPAGLFEQLRALLSDVYR